MREKWTKESLKIKLFEMLDEGHKINPASVLHIEGFYRDVRKFYGNYETFLVECGLEPTKHFHRGKNLTNLKSITGLLFEEFLNDIFLELGMKFSREVGWKTKPDFVVNSQDEQKWIDAKLSEEVALRSKSIAKYKDLCDKLILVYLIGEIKDYYLTEDVRIIHVSYFLNRIKEGYKKSNFIYRLDLLVKLVETIDKEYELIKEELI